MPEDAVTRELTNEELVNQVVTYHAPDAEGIAKISNVREGTKFLILTILRNCPASPDRSAAIRSVRLAMMQANASIVVPQIQL